ncbi:MAG: phosphatase PAP2 family protein [Bacteroidota bacterium]
METLQQLGIGLIQALQALSPALDGLMHSFTFLGKIEFYLIFIPFIYWAVDKRLGIRLLVLLITSNFMVSALKVLFHQPRPYWLGEVKGLAQEPSYGLPSSHASDTLSVWGYLAHHTKKAWMWIAAAVILLFIGISRTYLGVHFPHDVLFGWLLGAIWLLVFARSEKPLAAWANRQGLAGGVGLALVFSLMAIVVGGLVQMSVSGRTDPAEWSAFAVQARSPSYMFTLAGSLFGALAGYVLMKALAPFENSGSWLQRLARYLLGIVGVLLLYFGLDTLFSLIAPDQTVLGYALRYLRYAVLTLWTMFLAPWIFVKIGLARRTAAAPSEELIPVRAASSGTGPV